MAPRIQVNFIPHEMSRMNVRTYHPDWWDEIRFYVYAQAGYVCEICGAFNCIMHAHEEWDWYTCGDANVQVLVDIMALCEECHGSKHYIRTAVASPSRTIHIREHMMHLNGWTELQLNEYIHQEFSIWVSRMRITYDLDLSLAREIYRRAMHKPRVIVNGLEVS